MTFQSIICSWAYLRYSESRAAIIVARSKLTAASRFSAAQIWRKTDCLWSSGFGGQL